MTKLEKLLMDTLKKAKRPLSQMVLWKQMRLGRPQYEEFHSAVGHLTATGQILYLNGRYSVSHKKNLVPAAIIKVTDTFGFARPLQAGEKDIFIPGRHLQGSMPGDQVLVKTSKSATGELIEGVVAQVLEEVDAPFSATLLRSETGQYSVKPDKYVKFPIMLAKNAPVIGQVGEKVLAKIRKRGKRHQEHTAEILQVFGDSQRAASCAEAILAENNIFREFSPEALEQAQAIGSSMGIHPKELEMRTDRRKENIFTIDGADTKDIDDAISLVAHEKGWTLGVHIADVSYYVTRQSPLDQDAFTRGTSVYFANQVVPMLPPELSNGICSLNPQEDRLAFSAIIELSKQGNIASYKFEKSVICSRIKGVYSEVNRILDEKKPPRELLEKYAEQLGTLQEMQSLAQLLHQNRKKRFALDLESRESKILFDEQGNMTEIVTRTQGTSESMIEEFMLVANEAAATLAIEKGLPFVYRVHEFPENDRLERLYEILDNLGVSYQRTKAGENPAQSLDQVLDSVKGSELEGIVNYSILRSMAKAQYSADNQGHFGLALKNYTHFTSPIRRYPDLAIHRILSCYVTGMRQDNLEKYFRKWVSLCATNSTKREIAAMSAERETEDAYKAEFMGPSVGKEFEGIVSSVISFGIFVELPNTVEGLIRLENFPPGRWSHDGLVSYKNEVGGARIRLGDTVKIKVVGSNVAAGQIDFAFAEPGKYSAK